MYNYSIKIIVFTACFMQFQMYAGKKVFSYKKNESSSVSGALSQPSSDVMYDPILGSCLTALARSASFQNKSLRVASTDSMLGEVDLPRALQRSESGSKTSSATNSAISSTVSSFSRK